MNRIGDMECVDVA